MEKSSQLFLWYYATSQLKLKYRHTYLGFMWNFIEPALFLIVLSFIFSVVNNMDITDFAVYLFAGLLPWRYFEQTVNLCQDSIATGDWLLKKMYVSPIILPITKWLIATMDFMIAFVVLLFLLTFLKENWTIHLIVLPLSMIPWALLGLGLGLILSVLYTFFRDIKPIVQMFLMFTFFSSPILIKIDVFSGLFQESILRFHPLTYFAALFQKPIYYSAWPNLIDWVFSFTTGIISLAVGYFLINHYRNKFYYYL